MKYKEKHEQAATFFADLTEGVRGEGGNLHLAGIIALHIHEAEEAAEKLAVLRPGHTGSYLPQSLDGGVCYICFPGHALWDSGVRKFYNRTGAVNPKQFAFQN